VEPILLSSIFFISEMRVQSPTKKEKMVILTSVLSL